MQLHPIALTMRSCGAGLLECIMMTLFKKREPFSYFFSSLQGRTRPYKAEWLVACQGILKNSSLPRRTCLFFPGSLGSLFPQWISSPCFLGWLGSPVRHHQHFPAALKSPLSCIYLFKSHPLSDFTNVICSEVQNWGIISESKWVVHELCNWYACRSTSLEQTDLLLASHFA